MKRKLTPEMHGKNSSVMERNNEFEWNQFCRLGEMMGDGLHHEPDGRWIAREYKRLAKILIPDIREAETLNRKVKNARVDEQMAEFLEDKSCSCGGKLKQSRSGSKVLYCQTCSLRYKVRTK